MSRPLRLTLVPVAAAALALVGCAPADDDTTTAGGSETTAAGGTADAADDCTPESLETLEDGTLTIATSEPAYEPWMVDNDPANGEGFESAVAYAVAGQLGFSITDERRQAVDFSSPYYDVRLAVVADEGNPAAGATTLADLQGVRLGGRPAWPPPRSRSSPPPSHRCSTRTTTPSWRWTTARSTRSSSTCRPPSTSPRWRSRAA
ncbi:MAG TPA: hypothetical protein VK894_14870 [Jiangellales bacterium]|nr:hypothetical protein [Jiangellales bacterium]